MAGWTFFNTGGTHTSMKKYLLISLAAIVVVFGVFVVITMKKMFTPTRGAKIAAYSNPQKALLVIDVQEDYTGLKGKQPVLYPNVESQITAINGLIDRASKAGVRVVYIRQIFDDNFISRLLGGRTIEGKPGAEIDARIHVVNRNDFTKKISDAFSNQQLNAFLALNQVDELYLVGLDAAYCVYNTAKGALNRGYKVKVVKDAILTRKSMNDILKRYKQEEIPVTTSSEVAGI